MSRDGESQLKRFFADNRDAIVPSGRGRRTRVAADAEITHTSLDGMCGGTFSIPPKRLDEFYNAYGQDLHRGLKLYIVERHTEPVFVMHLDVDFKALEEPERVQAFCDLVHATVAEYYQGPVKTVVCAVMDAAGQRKAGAPGLHFIFPKTNVDREQALLLREGIVARCHTELPWGGDWDTIVDISVLSNRGGALRMLGSDKCRKCEDCARNGFCTRLDCHAGRIYENKIYGPWQLLPKNAETATLWQNLQGNPAYAAKFCTVRCLPEAKCRPDFSPPPMAPRASRMSRETRGRASVRNADGQFVYALHSEPGVKERGFEAVQLEDSVQEALLETIRGYHENYAQLGIKRGGVLRSLAPSSAVTHLVKIQGFGERYCCNKEDTHRQSTIYFAVYGHQGCIRQKCYCTKDDIRPGGGTSCGSFSGRSVFLPDAIPARLLGASTSVTPPRAEPQPQPTAEPQRMQLQHSNMRPLW